MSRVGKKPITIPDGVTISVSGNTITAKGSKGQLTYDYPETITVEVNDNKVIITRSSDMPAVRSAHGLVRSLVQNMATGVKEGFQKRMEIIGVGYKAQASGRKATLSLGFSHPVEFEAPEGITIEMDAEAKNTLVISGIDKQLVGQTCADIRKYRPPEPYKGKGIRYVGEYVPRKAGKSAAK